MSSFGLPGAFIAAELILASPYLANAERFPDASAPVSLMLHADGKVVPALFTAKPGDTASTRKAGYMFRAPADQVE